MQVPPDVIGPSPYQTRAAESEEELAGLAASIAASGILNPLTVRRAGPDAPSGVRWELVFGHRRLAAARLAGLPMVPCVALDMDDGAARLANVVENLQRKDLSPLEEADGVAALTEGGKTAPEIARLLGVSERWVFRRRRLSAITKTWRTIIAEKKAGQVFCERLAALPRPMQIRLLDTELAAKPEPDRIGQALWDAGARDILRMPWAERHPEWCAECANTVNNTARDGEGITGAPHILSDCRFCGNPACLAEKTAVFVSERWDWVRKAVPPSAPKPVKIKREWDAPYPRKDKSDAKHCHAHIVTDGPDAGRILWCKKPAEPRTPKERKEIPGRREELDRIRAAHALIRERIEAGEAPMNLIPAAALLLVYRTQWGINKWPDRAERLGHARRLTPEEAARAFLECATSSMEPWIDEHRYLTQPEAHPANYIGEAEALAGLFGLDEAAIAAKIAEGAADGDD